MTRTPETPKRATVIDSGADPNVHTLILPSDVRSVGDLHAMLVDLGIQGVTRQGDKTWVTFADEPSPQVRGEIMRRVKKP